MTGARIVVYEYLTALPQVAPADAPLLEMGRAMRDAMVRDLQAIEPEAPMLAIVGQGLRELPGRANAPDHRPASALDPADWLRAHAAPEELIWLVAPETGDLLAQAARAVPAARWIGCEPGVIELTTRKSATTERLASAGIATPRQFLDDPAVAQWVVKPDDGAGALGTRRHESQAGARADAQARTAWAEPWVPGVAMSLSALALRSGVELLCVNRQSIRVDEQGWAHDEGVSFESASPDPLLRNWTREIAAALPGLRGFFGIDFVWHPSRGPVAIEVNPRVTCAYAGLSQRLGRNLAQATLQDHLARHPAGSPR